MKGMDGLTDLEFEEPILISSVISKKRRKIIDLDDLVADYEEQIKLMENKSKRKKAKKKYNLVDETDAKEATLSSTMNKCHQLIDQISNEDEMASWGLQVFGNQKTLPEMVLPELGSCMLLQSFMDHDFRSLIELHSDQGETFLEGLLLNGWLSKLVNRFGDVESSIARWTFNLMLYSSRAFVATSACNFWCGIVSSQKEGDLQAIAINWLPSYSDFKMALETYGFLVDSLSKPLLNTEMVHPDLDSVGPPQNIRAWIKFTAACCRARDKHLIFSISEAEELVDVILCLFLDRQLLGLSVILHECLLSVTNFFTDQEWNYSCKEIAKSIACRVPKDSNCLKMVESISAGEPRTKHLRGALAFQVLLACFDGKFLDAENVLRFLISINVKDKDCDLQKMYVYLVLAENWLLSTSMLANNPAIYELWVLYLRNCSCQITSSDLRTYASKIRSKASYLLQGIAIE